MELIKLYENITEKIEIIVFSDKFGQKIAIKSPYNVNIIAAIKRTDWEITHRKFESNIGWIIDYTQQSVQETISKWDNGIKEKGYQSVLEGLTAILNTKIDIPNKQKKSDFINIECKANEIVIDDVIYKKEKYSGTTYQINAHIKTTNLPIIMFWNKKASNKTKEMYGRSMSNSIGMLADFLSIGHTKFYEIMASENPQEQKRTIVQDLITNENDRIMRISIVSKEIENKKENRVFNISTEVYEIVPFNEIEETIVSLTGKPIEKEKMGGSIIWRIKSFTTIADKENLTGLISISSGNNVKRSSIKVIGLIKVGSCDNSIHAFSSIYIKHTTNWKERFKEAFKLASTAITTATTIIKNAMQTHISLQDCFNYIDKCDFGLQDDEKINILKSMIKNRVKIEHDRSPTLWALSQTYSYIGTHETEINDGVNNRQETYSLNLALQERLQTESFTLIQTLMPMQS